MKKLILCTALSLIGCGELKKNYNVRLKNGKEIKAIFVSPKYDYLEITTCNGVRTYVKNDDILSIDNINEK